ncbi:hypothetical protein SDC9_189351 [bioreactor metagenome]|uniref:Uncharacterized protein n=1 Tax=bioreactor metagenome TaxID=1076179 RepID=A0A645HT97_9ZZZZ
MVPHYKRALFHGFLNCIYRIVLFKLIYIFDKQSIEVTNWFLTGDFSTFNHNKTDGFTMLHGHFVGFIKIRIGDILERTMFDMVGNSNRIQTIVPGFVHAYHRSHLSVGKDRMSMEITFQGHIPIEIRQMNDLSVIRLNFFKILVYFSIP